MMPLVAIERHPMPDEHPERWGTDMVGVCVRQNRRGQSVWSSPSLFQSLGERPGTDPQVDQQGRPTESDDSRVPLRPASKRCKLNGQRLHPLTLGLHNPEGFIKIKRGSLPV